MRNLYRFQAKAASKPLALRELQQYVTHMLKVTKTIGDARTKELAQVFVIDWHDNDQNMMYAANRDRITAYTNMLSAIAQWNLLAPEQQVAAVEIDEIDKLRGKV